MRVAREAIPQTQECDLSGTGELYMGRAHYRVVFRDRPPLPNS